MFFLLLILAVIALWASPSLRRSLAQLLDPDDRREGHNAPERELS